ncbi:MAG: S8 family serine peptidase [Woeseiaceae bacterium]
MPLDSAKAFGRWLAIVTIGSILAAAGAVALYTLFVPPDVQMPSRVVAEGGVDSDFDDDLLGMDGSERRHFVVQFRRELTAGEVTDLGRRLGITLDGPIPENAYMTSVLAADWERVRDSLTGGSPKAVKIFPFATDDKVSSELRSLTPATLPDYAMADTDVQVFVTFFSDVPPEEQKALLIAFGATQPDVTDENIRAGPSGTWAVLIEPDTIWTLADEDSVRFIELTTSEIVEDMDQARKDVGVAPLDVTGEGALIAQWEGCQPTTLHPDMQDRIAAVGPYTIFCRAWWYLDLDDSTHYDANEPIAIDTDEDGEMDAILFAGGTPDLADLESDEWIELPVRYARNAGLYVKKPSGDISLVELDDLRLQVVFWPISLFPDPVKVGDTNIGKTLFEFIFAEHPTLVAGTMITNSNSMQSAGEPMYPGVAPMGNLRSYAWNHMSTTAQYPNAAYSGARISSNSFGWTDDYYHYLPTTDAYGKISRFYDVASSGRTETGAPSTLGTRMLIVGSTGNEGDHSNFWRTARIANSAKNVLSVGNVSSAESESSEEGLGLPAEDSGRGPTRFGRLTPILSAPGDHFKCDLSVTDVDCDPHADGGIMTTAPEDGYKAVRGTSFSTPIVSSTAALLSQAYEQRCEAEPQPQDLRALLVHSARDLVQAGNLEELDTDTMLVGPDFVFGYGLLQAEEAFGLIRHTVQHEIGHGWVEHKINLNSDAQLVDNAGVKQLRVTLVWDDPAYYSGYAPRAVTGFLQNDLDLEVIGPDGRRHLPWVLDASTDNEGDPATRKTCTRFQCVLREYRDHANTVEQVVVNVPENLIGETWTIRVRGFKLRRGPQSYTLVSEAFRQLPGVDCGKFSNGHTIEISNPFDLPDTRFWCLMFWVALILLLWLIFEAMLWLFDTLRQAGYTYFAWLAVALALLILVLVFRLVHAQVFLMLAILVFIGLFYVYWRAKQP